MVDFRIIVGLFLYFLLFLGSSFFRKDDFGANAIDADPTNEPRVKSE